ncbi:hypothetical protein FQN54_004303 [Arachnomyces sp. PD_36]|nr:hypothetical protein FQN54_004303 [Arachnomyces sp. PD_36]
MQKILNVFIAFLGVATAGPSRGRCRCLPDDGCWPGPDQWQALNSSLDGDLVAVKPVNSVCHDPTFDEQACEAVLAKRSNSLWRSEEPGAVQYDPWCSWPSMEESCYSDSPREEPCGQGRISLYSVLAESVQDIQNTVTFAYERSLRLVIKNSGHDFLGRSSAPDSLQLSTHKLDDIEFIDDFIPEGCDKESEGPAVTICAGVQLKKLYEAVAAQGLTVVAGYARTVGAAGGYIQGGGHSPMGPWKGMAADNALEFKVVTAEGGHVTANEYINSDLFWALRGGGGGTFGVVTSVTLRTHPEDPVIVATLDVGFPTEHDPDSFWEAVATFHEHLPSLNDAGGSGYYFITQAAATQEPDHTPSLSAPFFYTNQTGAESVKNLYEPLLNSLEKIDNATVKLETSQAPSIVHVLLADLDGEADSTGVAFVLGSRMFSRNFFADPDINGPARLSETMRSFSTKWGGQFQGHVVAGGQVAANRDIDSAVNPAWRDALSHLIFGRQWATDGSVSFEEQEAIMANVTEVEVPLFKALDPGSGAYMNEADPNEADFQTSFWGKENYERLYRIKQEWDPSGLFISRKGVGSEDWDDTGLCRL